VSAVRVLVVAVFSSDFLRRSLDRKSIRLIVGYGAVYKEEYSRKRTANDTWTCTLVE
jgi:hypothetical protein